MPLLKVKNHDEEKERRFTLECQRKLTIDDRFQMLLEKSKLMRELLRSHGHTPPPQIVKRKKG